MRSSEPLLAAAIAAALTFAIPADAQTATPKTAPIVPKVLASCPPGASFVNITEGSYNPPSYAIPDVQLTDEAGMPRNEWNLLNQDPNYMPSLKAICSYGGDTTATATRKVEIEIPREVRLCILNKGTFACFDRRP